jgi:fructose/tagatose bisphosphate aldolase
VSQKHIIVHSLAEAKAVAAAASLRGVPVILLSARGMAGFMGPMWFKALVEEAAAHPGARLTAMLDCADEAGSVLAALRVGFTRVLFTGPEATRARLDEIARQLDAVVVGQGDELVLDLLGVRDPESAICDFLAPD